VRIGIVSEALPYLPSSGGFRLYGANLIRCLSRNHEVELVSFLESDDSSHLDWARKYCVSVHVLEWPRQRRILAPASLVSAHLFGRPLQGRRQLGNVLQKVSQNWEVLHVEGPYAAGLIPARLEVPKLLSAHDSWTIRCAELRRCAQSPSERIYYTMLAYHEPRYERLVYPRFGRCVFVTERDAAEVRRIAPGAKCVVVSNGVDTEYYQACVSAEDTMTMVFHGHLGYGPNAEAALFFANEILPLIRHELPQAAFRLVGAQPGSAIRELAQRPGISIAADLPDIRQALASANVYVSPILHGSGIKNKVLEAMALSLPIVCFSPSVEGIPCVPDQHVLIARDPSEFAAKVVDLLRAPTRASEIGRAARRLVEEAFSWDSRAAAFERLYGDLRAEAPQERLR